MRNGECNLNLQNVFVIKTGHTISAYVKQHLPIMLVEHLEQEGPDVGKALKKCKHSGILHVL